MPGQLVAPSAQLVAPPGQYLTLPGQFLTLPDQLLTGSAVPGRLAVAGCLVAAALVVATLLRPASPFAAPPRPVFRLAALREAVLRLAVPGGRGAYGETAIAVAAATPTGPAGAAATRRRPDLIRFTAALAGIATAVVVGGWLGLVTGVLAGGTADRLLRRIEPPAARNRRLAEVADLPLAADLLAAAMRAGAPVDRAVTAVAEALGGPLADRLGRVGRILQLGGGPDEAWAHLAPVAGADRLVNAAIRSAESGAALAGALSRLADELRTDRATAAEASARRAGVLIVLPLGLCFLPAFILAGLVPVIVAVLGDVL